MITKFTDTPTLLEQIRNRPQMWHGGNERSALLLSTFLSAFSIAEAFYKIDDANIISGFNWEEFETWVEQKYNPKRLTYSSFSLASHLSSNEPEAFDLWYCWYDKYCEYQSKN